MLDSMPTFGRHWNFALILKSEKYSDYIKRRNRVYYNGNDAHHEPTARNLEIGKKPYTYRSLQLLSIFYYVIFLIFRVRYILCNMLRAIEPADNAVVHISKWVQIYFDW